MVDYNIPEKLVVKFENDDNNYLVNLNDGSYSRYTGKYNSYGYDFELSTGSEITEHDIKIFNRKIYNQSNEQVYRYINSGFFEAYWSQNGKYVISRNGYIARIFGLFLSIETANPTMTIVEPSTGKMKQILFDGIVRDVEKILGYVD